jgi:uncharacterized protein (DUF488 family)
MTTKIFTFGYEGLQLDEFIRQLQNSKIERVVDVRAVPLSRKKGFSKSALSSALLDAGITYSHCVAMGCPKAVREQYRKSGNWQDYTAKFLTYLRGQSEELKQLAKVAAAERCCLICFEEDFNFCHRTFVARALGNLTGQSIAHIMDRRVIPDPKRALAA